MKTIIEDGAKFAIKEVDESGNSLGTGVERFDTKEDAQKFIDGADEAGGPGQTEPHGAEGDQPETAPENAPVEEGVKEPGESAPADSNDGQA